MWKNYFIVAIRALMRQKVYALINILGLTAGVTASLLIVLYVADELSYDRFHHDAEDVYRLNFNGKVQGDDIVSASVGMPVAEAMQRECTGVQDVVRVDKWMTCPVRYEDNKFTEMNFLLADSNFFSFFDYKLLVGNPHDALRGPNKIVISERAATRYFGYTGQGDRSPLGKTLVIGSEGAIQAEVTGIAANPPHNSHLQYDFVMSLETSGYMNNPVWISTEVYTYVRLFPGTPVATLQRTLDGFVEKYCARDIAQFLNQSMDQFRSQGGHIGFTVVPLTDIHLKSHLNDELEPNGNIEYVYLFAAIAGFIVLLACINYMNLSTARSANRAREIGVRKAIGALRSRLMGQFMLESFMYVIIAFALALMAVYTLLTPFNLLAGKQLTTAMLLEPVFLVSLVAFMLVIGLLAGSYPAFYLTSFKPVEVLKGKLRAGSRSAGIRNGLVVFQFFVSIALIVSAVMVYQQLRFLQRQSVGFDKENVVGMMHTMNLGKNAQAFKEEIMRYPEFVAASYSNRLPPNLDWFATFEEVTLRESHLFSFYQVDFDHLKTLGFTMADGRYFSPDFPSDSSAIIINETALRQLNLGDWRGKRLRNTGDTQGKGFEIIGVVKDFNYESLKTKIGPLIMMLGSTPNWDIAVRLSPGDPQPKIKRLGELWKKYAPTVPFEYSFIDDTIHAKFNAEKRLSEVIVLFTGLAVFIACLGLFGLATFATEQRAKEISIRKVMGASVSQVVILLSRDFARLIIMAYLLAIPLAWYGLERWLEGFAYHTSFSLQVALVAGVAALGIALLTVSVQSIKAAVGNPVDALRSEN